VPEDWLSTDLYHRLWPEQGLLAEARSEPTCEYHGLHGPRAYIGTPLGQRPLPPRKMERGSGTGSPRKASTAASSSAVRESAANLALVRVCIVYDCLFPHTVGGAERWYRNLSERLAERGHEVTYLTLRQWERGDEAGLDGVRVITVGPRMSLYVRGRRRILPPLVFGLGTLWHLMRHGRRYDVVHTASFPYFSLLAAGLTRPVCTFRLVVDWHEYWTREYWLEYLGSIGGRIGWAVQSLCLRIPQRAFCFSQLQERRLRGSVRGDLTVLQGEYSGRLEVAAPRPSEPVVVFAGRHIPEKRVGSLVPAIARARRDIPDLRCEIYGDGPERPSLVEAVAAHGLERVITLPGFADREQLDEAVARALCLLLPSRREGYGLVVVEAAASATPTIVVEGPDNAATELVDDGENGFIAPSASPEDLAAAIVRVHKGGYALRESTAAWFNRNSGRLSIDSSLETVLDAYRDDPMADS
jgi:glycosyltransferase involved in cell wall biosynthesis